MTVNTKLADIIAKTLKIEPAQITPNLAAGNTENWDSIGHLEILMSVEEVFDVRFNTEEMLEYNSVALLESALKKAGALVDG